MNELKLLTSQAEADDSAPQSGPQLINLEDFKARAEQGRQKAARVFQVYSAGKEGVLKAHADPFDRAIDVQDEVA